MIPDELVAAADDQITDEIRLFVLTQIRSLDEYKKGQASYPDLDGRLVKVQAHTLPDPTDTLTPDTYSGLLCQTINAGATLIKAVGSGRTQIIGGPKGFTSKKQDNREEFAYDILYALYDSGVPASQAEIAENTFAPDTRLFY